MILNKIKIRNFLSISEIDLDFSKFEGVTLIKGINNDFSIPTSNGSGKSAIIEAVIWGLFGKTIRKTVEKTLSHFVTAKGCFVELVVNDDIIIRRGKKPSKLEVISDGKNISKESVPKTQEELEKLLDVSYKSTLASLVFGQHNSVNFIASSPEEKRNLIQRYLSVDKIFELRDSTLKLKSGANSSLKEEQTKFNIYKKELDFISEKMKRSKKAIKEGSSLLQNPKILDLIKKKSLEELYDQEAFRENLSSEIADLIRQKETLNKLIIQNKELIDFLTNSKCQNCGFRVEANTKKMEEVKEDLEEIRRKIKKVEISLKKKSKEHDNVTIQLSNCDLDVLRDLSKMESELTSLKDSEKRYKEMYSSSAGKAEVYKKKYELFKFWERAFSEKGLIKYIIRNVLGFLNKRCNHYLSFLSNSTFKINLLDDLTIDIFHGTCQKHYDVLSGGEKRRLEMSVTLALNDLASLSNNTQTDLVFFDEAVENLDTEGVKGFFNLLKEISKIKKIFVITHNQYLKSLLDDITTITVEKTESKSKVTKIDYKNKSNGL